MTDWQQPAAQTGSQWFRQGNQPCLRPSTFRDLVYSIPRPRHTISRVMKPRSAGNSPSSTTRRRSTMPHGSAAVHRPVSNQGFQYDPALLGSAIRERRSRPISWHPASARYMGYSTPYFQAPASQNPTAMEMPSQHPNTVPYGDDNLFSYPMQDLPIPNDSFAPFTVFQEPAPMPQPGFMPMDASQLDPGWDIPASTMSTMPPPMPECWAFDMMSMNNSIPSADIASSSYESVPSSGGLTGPSTPELDRKSVV